jgi:hypothetical protein
MKSGFPLGMPGNRVMAGVEGLGLFLGGDVPRAAVFVMKGVDLILLGWMAASRTRASFILDRVVGGHLK